MSTTTSATDELAATVGTESGELEHETGASDELVTGAGVDGG